MPRGEFEIEPKGGQKDGENETFWNAFRKVVDFSTFSELLFK